LAKGTGTDQSEVIDKRAEAGKYRGDNVSLALREILQPVLTPAGEAAEDELERLPMTNECV